MTGLIGWWPLHETSGDTAHDLSGNENHGSNNGAKKRILGRKGMTAYNFDGNGDYVGISDPKILQNYISLNTSFSLSVWVSLNAVEGTSNVFTLNNEDTVHNFNILVQNNGRLGGSMWDGDDSIYEAGTPEEFVETDKWYHVTYVKSGKQAYLFVNGDLYTDDVGISTAGEDSAVIGDRSDQNVNPWNGKIQDLRIYNRALNHSEVQELYRQGSQDLHKKSFSDGSDSGAISRWKLEDGGSDGSTAIDSWGSNDGTINGASFTDNSVRNEGRALQFNGDSDFIELPDGALTGFEDLSIVTFVRTNNPDKSQAIIDNWYWNDEERAISLRIGRQGNADLSAYISPNGSDWDRFYVEEVIAGSAWQMVSMTYDGSEGAVKLYVNGQIVGSSQLDYSGQIHEYKESTNIGRRPDVDDYFLDGTIDNVMVFDRVLEPWEVFELYRWGSLGKDMRKELVNAKGGGQ